MGIYYGDLLWADMNAATPPGSPGRSALCAGANTNTTTGANANANTGNAAEVPVPLADAQAPPPYAVVRLLQHSNDLIESSMV